MKISKLKAALWSFVRSSGFLLDIWRLLFTDQIIKNSCVLWSKDSAEHMRPSLWKFQVSFLNTLPSFWGFKRKLKARLKVLKSSAKSLKNVFAMYLCCNTAYAVPISHSTKVLYSLFLLYAKLRTIKIYWN